MSVLTAWVSVGLSLSLLLFQDSVTLRNRPGQGRLLTWRRVVLQFLCLPGGDYCSFEWGFPCRCYFHLGLGDSLWRGHPVHCRMVSSTAGLHPLDACSTSPPSDEKQRCFCHYPVSPGELPCPCPRATPPQPQGRGGAHSIEKPRRQSSFCWNKMTQHPVFVSLSSQDILCSTDQECSQCSLKGVGSPHPAQCGSAGR